MASVWVHVSLWVNTPERLISSWTSSSPATLLTVSRTFSVRTSLMLVAVRNFRETVQDYGPIPAQKRLLAIATGDARWVNVRPPLTAMCDGAGRDLADLLQREFDFALSL